MKRMNTEPTNAAHDKYARSYLPPTHLTLEERVELARHNLVLIMAAIRGGDDVEHEDLVNAISVAAEDALDMLEPLRQTPAGIATWRPAADGDKAKKGAR